MHGNVIEWRRDWYKKERSCLLCAQHEAWAGCGCLGQSLLLTVGKAASEGYLEAMLPETSEQRKVELEQQLLRYCKFDTEAMVRLVRHLGKGN